MAGRPLNFSAGLPMEGAIRLTWEVAVALQGTLDTFALADVLRLLAATGKTGRLEVDGERGRGSLWLDGGAVVAADVDAAHVCDTTDVVFELLRHREGSFSFAADESTAEVHDAVAVEGLLDAAESKLAEWREIEAVVPSLSAWISLVPELAEDEAVITRARWAHLVAVGEGRTVADLGARLELGEVDVSRLVKGLADATLVQVAVDEGKHFASTVDGHWEADIVIEDDPDARDAILADLVADRNAEADLDEVVRAELDADLPRPTEVDPESLGGSHEVGMDASLDAAADDHAYLTAADLSAGTGAGGAADVLAEALPEPLPIAGEATPTPDTDPFGHAPAAGAVEDDTETAPAPAPTIEPAATAEVTRQLTQLSPQAARAIAAAAGNGDPTKSSDEPERPKKARPEEPMNRNGLMKFISSK